MDDATSYDIVLPIEVLREFVLNDVSQASLVRWCLVSHELAHIAGPLLYRTIILRRAEDVIPFFQRLCFRPAPPPWSPSPPIFSLAGITRIEILELPSVSDFLDAASLVPSWPSATDLVVAVKYTEPRAGDCVHMTCVWIPALICFLEPIRFEEIVSSDTTEKVTVLEGKFLSLFTRIYDQKSREDGDGHHRLLYEICTSLPKLESEHDALVAATRTLIVNTAEVLPSVREEVATLLQTPATPPTQFDYSDVHTFSDLKNRYEQVGRLVKHNRELSILVGKLAIVILTAVRDQLPRPASVNSAIVEETASQLALTSLDE